MQKHLDIIRQKPVVESKKRKLSKKQKVIIGIALSLLLIGVVGGIVLNRANSSAAYIKSDKYQALFLTNSQVYFGKLSKLHDGSYRMTDVFYLQASANVGESTDQAASDPTKQAAAQQSPTLVQLGEELHGPDSEVVFQGAQVLFWENLKSDGKVVKAIDAYKQKNQ